MVFKNIKKTLLIIFGTIALIVGIIGIFIPILPTTPLLLLTSFCYIRSSPRLYNWLINHKVFGSYIYNYINHRAINNKAKVMTLLLLWASLTISFILVGILHVRILLIVVGLGVTTHILLLKNMKKIKIEKDIEAELLETI